MRLFNLFFAFPLLISASLAAQEPRVIAVEGFLQFWQRTCTENGCGLPEPLSERLPVEGTLVEPASPATLGMFRHETSSDTAQALLQVFWKKVSDTDHYLVAQTLLKDRATQERLAECTIYAGDDKPLFGPVGACSAFVSQDGVKKQIGVSFSK